MPRDAELGAASAWPSHAPPYTTIRALIRVFFALSQLRINEFSRLNSRKAEQKKAVERLQKSLQDLEDASEGVLLGDGNPGDVKIMHGESFFNIDSDAANAYIEATKEASLLRGLGLPPLSRSSYSCASDADHPGAAPDYAGGPCGHRVSAAGAEGAVVCPPGRCDQPGRGPRAVAGGSTGGDWRTGKRSVL